MRFFIDVDCRSSAGFGGMDPAAMTLRFHGPDCMAPSMSTRPIRIVVTPTDPSSLRYSAAFGRRRSASTRTTFSPECASVSARLHTVVDLPSSGTELVTT
jgi:hypothetical protein